MTQNEYNCGFCGGKYNEKNKHYRDCDNCILAKIYIRMLL